MATAYTRARELCRQVGDTPQLFSVLYGLWRFYSMHARLQTAHEVEEQFLVRARNMRDAAQLSYAHAMQSQTWYLLGEFVQAKTHTEKGLAFYDPQQHRSQVSRYNNDARGICLTFDALALWGLGYPDQALRRSQEALAWGQELSNAFSLAFILEQAAVFHVFRREEWAVQERAEAGVTLAREHGFALREAYSNILLGWVLARQDRSEEGITRIREGVTAWRATGAEVAIPFFLAWLAEAYGKSGRQADGLRAVDEALAIVGKTGERIHEAELHRLRGELTLQKAAGGWGLGTGEEEKQKSKGKNQKASGTPRTQHPTPSTHEAEREAEGYFLKAIDIARRQQAKSLELRAVMSVVRLRQQQVTDHATRETDHAARAALAAAHGMLSEVHGWFTEGFDTRDLREAAALLSELLTMSGASEQWQTRGL